MPLISIVIPCLNEEKYLPLLLHDLTHQTNLDFEVLVVDAQSPDQTVTKAKAFQSKIANLTIINSPKRNVSYQRNLGAKKSSGQYILFMDADNRLPHYFTEGIRYRLHKTKPHLFTCWCTPDSRQSSDKAIANFFNISIEAAKMIDNPYALGACIGLSKKTFAATKGFDENRTYCEDVEFVNRCSKLGYKLHIYKDPKFEISLRRFRKVGKLKTIQTSAILILKSLSKINFSQEKEYPTGGGEYFNHAKSDPKNLFENIQNTYSSVTKKPKILKKIQNLIASLDN